MCATLASKKGLSYLNGANASSNSLIVFSNVSFESCKLLLHPKTIHVVNGSLVWRQKLLFLLLSHPWFQCLSLQFFKLTIYFIWLLFVLFEIIYRIIFFSFILIEFWNLLYMNLILLIDILLFIILILICFIF